jgi:uncharacterized damage-inducible protein DinB
MNTIITMLLKELEQEAATTRKFLKLVPADKFDWQPHPKSMSMKQLSTHLADIPSWVKMTLETSGINFADNPFTPPPVTSNDQLLAHFEKSFDEGHTALAKATDEDLHPDWTLSNGDHIIMTTTKGEMIRISYSQIIHHRAQLGVYLRLLDIPIPGSYGPSADEM